MFAQDDWTETDASPAGEASPRDNVVFEAGLFGGALGIRRTFILHANGSKLPTDLLGLTSVRYDPAAGPAEIDEINQKLRKAIEAEGRRGLVEGLWWQLSLTARSEDEPSAVSLLQIARDRDGDLTVNGRSWQEDGTLSARYWSEAAKERKDPAGIFYCWKGERPRHPNAPQLEGTGEIRIETADRATGYFTTRSDRDAALNMPNRRHLPSSRPLGSRDAGQRERGRAGRRSSRSASRSGSRPRTRSEPGALALDCGRSPRQHPVRAREVARVAVRDTARGSPDARARPPRTGRPARPR